MVTLRFIELRSIYKSFAIYNARRLALAESEPISQCFLCVCVRMLRMCTIAFRSQSVSLDDYRLSSSLLLYYYYYQTSACPKRVKFSEFGPTTYNQLPFNLSPLSPPPIPSNPSCFSPPHPPLSPTPQPHSQPLPPLTKLAVDLAIRH